MLIEAVKLPTPNRNFPYVYLAYFETITGCQSAVVRKMSDDLLEMNPLSLNKQKMIREIGRRTRLKNRDVERMLETLIEGLDRGVSQRWQD